MGSRAATPVTGMRRAWPRAAPPMIVTDAVQTQVRYYFDALGVGRWVITDDQAGDGPLAEQLAEQLAVVEVHGYCDGCEAREISSETVGSYARLFHDEDHATEIGE